MIISKKTQNEKTISLVKDDITKRQVDVIVNAANSHLAHGAGVAGAIVRNGGSIIQIESDKIGFVPVGSVAITTAGDLPCKAVIHAVGPTIGEGNENEKLKSAVKNSLTLASEKNYTSIAIPAISSGIFGFPKDRCAKILVNEVRKFLKENPKTSLETIEFCIRDDETLTYFIKELES